MDYETKLNEQRVAGEEKGRTEGRTEGLAEATTSDVKIMIGVLKKYHLSSDQIRAEITDSFKDRMTKAELDKLLKNI